MAFTPGRKVIVAARRTRRKRPCRNNPSSSRSTQTFFLTTPFEPAIGEEPGREYVALFLFDAEGGWVEAKIDDLGPRASLDEAKGRRLHDERLASLGDVVFDRIEVKPFVLNRFDREFGLIAREPKSADDQWVVEMMPGNCMAFYEPWDSGDYDT